MQEIKTFPRKNQKGDEEGRSKFYAISLFFSLYTFYLKQMFNIYLSLQ